MVSKLVFTAFTRRALGALALLAGLSGASQAQEAEINLYSARHYATDEALYADFTRATGIVRERKFDIGDRVKAGEVLAVIETQGLPCYACMLGGPEGRHLFMLCAPSSDAEVAASAAKGVVLVTEVDAPGAGRP